MEDTKRLTYKFNDRWHELTGSEALMALEITSADSLAEYIVTRDQPVRTDSTTPNVKHREYMYADSRASARRRAALVCEAEWTPLMTARLMGMTPECGLYIAANELGVSVVEAASKWRAIVGNDVQSMVWPRPLEDAVIAMVETGAPFIVVADTIHRDVPAVAGLVRRMREQGRMLPAKRTK